MGFEYDNSDESKFCWDTSSLKKIRYDTFIDYKYKYKG